MSDSEAFEALERLPALESALAAAQAEIAALRRVLAELVEATEPRTVQAPAAITAHEQAHFGARLALSAPSAAEPLLADIRAAVDKLEGATCAECSPTSCCGDCDRVFTALTALRRWVP